MPDLVKMAERGCTEESKAIVYEWAPGLERCPKSLFTAEVVEGITWWNEWRRYGSYPFGTGSFDTEPAQVLDVISCCQEAFDQAISEVSHG